MVNILDQKSRIPILGPFKNEGQARCEWNFAFGKWEIVSVVDVFEAMWMKDVAIGCCDTMYRDVQRSAVAEKYPRYTQ